VQTLISMAHSMGMRVVAEGVEEKDQLELLGELAIDEIQGYLLSKPIEAEAVAAMIRNPNQGLDTPANVVQLRP
jgi:EAL domain-containing protein (putative c-di-GMP-specific phosphodiesterase class I)